MVSQTSKPTREQRLAAKLRENLHRRKAQSRTMAEPGLDPAADRSAEETAAAARDDLSKPAPKS